MHAYEQALRVDQQSPAELVARAEEVLQRGAGVVLFDGMVAIHSHNGHLRADVIDPEVGAHRCEQEFRVLVENAARSLEQSELGARLRVSAMGWRVVRMDGEQVCVLWPLP